MAPVAATAAARAADRRRRSQSEVPEASEPRAPRRDLRGPRRDPRDSQESPREPRDSRREGDRARIEFEPRGSHRQPARGRRDRDPRRAQRPIGSLRRRVSGPIEAPVAPPPLREFGGEAPAPKAAATGLRRPATRPQQPAVEPDDRPRRSRPERARQRAVAVPVAPQRSVRERRRTEPRTRGRLRLRIDPRWLDRIVRGRLWIPLLAMLLIGIVAMRVEVLKLGARAGAATQLAAQLESNNQLLQSEVSTLSSPQRIQRLAADKYHMVPTGPLDTHFVQNGGRRTLTQALSSISAPDPAGFVAGLQAERQANGDTLTTGAGSTSMSGTATSSTSTAATSTSAAGGSTPTTGTTAGTTTGGTTVSTGSTGTTGTTGTGAGGPSSGGVGIGG